MTNKISYKFLSLLIFSLLVLGEAVYASDNVIKISAARLMHEYANDDARADAIYKGNELEISGTVDSLGIIGSILYVNLEAGDFLGKTISLTGIKIRNVSCRFPENAKRQLAQLYKGSKIVLSGTCIGMLGVKVPVVGQMLGIGSIGNVIIENCNIIEPKITPDDFKEVNVQQTVFTSSQLQQEYVKNRIAAELNYDGKYVKVSGIANNFDRDSKGIYIDLSDNVTCYFPDDKAAHMAYVSRGQQVIISGRNMGLKTFTVAGLDTSIRRYKLNFEDCSLVEPNVSDNEIEHELQNKIFTSRQFYSEYQANKLASAKFDYKRVNVSGKIDKFGEDKDGLYLVLKNNVVCYFSRENEYQLALLETGQEITINGQCEGINSKHINITRSILLTPKIETDVDLLKITYSPSQLLQEYKSSRITAKAKTGKFITVAGTIGEINFGKDGGGGYIGLNAESYFGNLKCYFSDDTMHQILTLSEGQSVKLTGKYIGSVTTLTTSLGLEECYLIEPILTSTNNHDDKIYSPSQLFEEYDLNAKAADIKFKNKLVSVTGTIDFIGQDGKYSYLTLSANRYLGSLNCYFSQANNWQLSQLNKGQRITLKGECMGIITTITGNIGINNCVLLEPQLEEINQENITFSPERLFDEYETNKTADENRKGKRITVSGKISKVWKNYIDIDAKRYLGVVRCYFSTSSTEQLKQYNKGENITITGWYVGKMTVNIGLEDFSIK